MTPRALRSLPQLRHRTDANAQAGPGSEAGDRMVAVEQLFDRSYLRRPVSPAQWAALVAYAPLGVVLALLRVILTVLLCAYAITTKAVVPAITPTDKTYACSAARSGWPRTAVASVHRQRAAVGLWNVGTRNRAGQGTLSLTSNISSWCGCAHRLFGLICLIAGVRVRKVYGNVPRGNELDHSFIVSNHTFTGDPGLLYFMLKDNARVRLVQRAQRVLAQRAPCPTRPLPNAPPPTRASRSYTTRTSARSTSSHATRSRSATTRPRCGKRS